MEIPGGSVSKEEVAREKSLAPLDPEMLLTRSTETSQVIIPTRLDTLAPELLLRIFGLLEQGTATCLGLTCRRLYSMLKGQYPDPIDLRLKVLYKNPACSECATNAPFRWSGKACCSDDLYYVLAPWIGPRYRICYVGWHKFLYYDRNVYGDIDNDPIKSGEIGRPLNALEFRVMDRYEDYYYAMKGSDAAYPFRILRSKEAPYPPLPYPFNKGEAWYSEAVNAIKRDVNNFKTVQAWRQFWSRLEIFREFHKSFDNLEEEHRRGLWSV